MTTLAPAPPGTRPRALSGWREIGFLALVYVGYALTRVLASDSLAPAVDRARHLVDLEQPLGLDVEHALTRWFADHDLLGTLAAFHYATAHYVVTMVVLVWLFFRRPRVYVAARRTLVIATSVALAIYLLAPTAPPRLVGGFTDVLAQHSAAGWWGGEASAPQGMGWMTNQLAAFPSMHAGWALWVALVVAAATPRLLPRMLAWSHAIITAVVVIGTGNHWTLDVVVGWALIAFVFKLAERESPDLEESAQPAASRDSALRTSAGSVVVHIGGSDALRNEP